MIELKSDSETPMQGQRSPNPKKNAWHIIRNFDFSELHDPEIMKILIVLAVPRFGMFCEPEVDELRESG